MNTSLCSWQPMFRLTILFVFFLFVCNMHGCCQSKIMSYNIRYNNPADQSNWWEYRKTEIVAMINYYQPDIIGIQEGLNDQVLYLDSALNQYHFVGVGRDDGHQKGEFTAIFYDTTQYHLIETHTFWLSPTPHKVSVGWDASMERICTYAVFLNQSTQDSLWVFNCHFDHIGKKARANSARLILEQIHKYKITHAPTVVLGDFNCLPNEKPIHILKTTFKDAYESSQTKPYGPIGTFNAFDSQHKLKERIDYILVKNLLVKKYAAIDDRRKNKGWLSDHLPILIHIEQL